MAKPDESIERGLVALPPLASALHTFAGRDEHGVLYPRLNLMLESEQLIIVPRFNHYIVQYTAQEHPEHYQRTVGLFSAFHRECLAMAHDELHSINDMHKAFEDFAAGLFTHRCINPDGSIDQTVVSNLLGLANSAYSNDPFVRHACTVRSELLDNELNRLGDYTLAATVAFVDVLASFEQRIIANQPKQQPTVA